MQADDPDLPPQEARREHFKHILKSRDSPLNITISDLNKNWQQGWENRHVDDGKVPENPVGGIFKFAIEQSHEHSKSPGRTDHFLVNLPPGQILPVYFIFRLMPWIKPAVSASENLEIFNCDKSCGKDILRTFLENITWIFEVWLCDMLESNNDESDAVARWNKRATIDRIINISLRKVRFLNSRHSGLRHWRAVIPILRTLEGLEEIVFDLRDPDLFSDEQPREDRWKHLVPNWPLTEIGPNDCLKGILKQVGISCEKTKVTLVGVDHAIVDQNMRQCLNPVLVRELKDEHASLHPSPSPATQQTLKQIQILEDLAMMDERS